MEWSDIEALGNGTYLWNGESITDYGSRWGYGYIVPIKELSEVDFLYVPLRLLFEVFTDKHGVRHVTSAAHIDSRADAFEFATLNRQQSIWDLRGDHVLYV